MDSKQYDYCLVASRTDVGCKRAANEDNMGQLDTINGRVVVVCDGMGGHVGGATASKIAVETILEFLNGQRFDDVREGMGMAIDAANKSILTYTGTHPELTGMGSTCVLLVIRDGLVYIAHVGDSRIYLIRNRIITQLTKDHSYVQMLVDSGEITKEQAEHHPRKNEITNALGLPNMTPATIKEDAIVPEAGDCFLLCSDGLSGPVEEKTINKIVSDHTIRVQQRADILIEKARENGGPDNITAQIVEFVMAPTEIANSRKKIYPAIWYVLGSVFLIAIGIVLFFVLKAQKGGTNDNGANENQSDSMLPPTEQITEFRPTSLDTIPQQTDTDVDRQCETASVKEPIKEPIKEIITNVGVGDSVIIHMMQNQWMIRIGQNTFLIGKEWSIDQYDIDLSINSTTNPTSFVWRNKGDFAEDKKFFVQFKYKENRKLYWIIAKKRESENQTSIVSATNVASSVPKTHTDDLNTDSIKSEHSKTAIPEDQATGEIVNSVSDKTVQKETIDDTNTVQRDSVSTENTNTTDSRKKDKRNK